MFLNVCVAGFFATSWVSSEWVDPVLSFFSEFVLVTSVSRPVSALELEGARGDGFPAFCSLVPEGVSVASGILLGDYTTLKYKELDDCRDYPNLVVRTMCYIAETGCFVKLSCAHNLLLAELATH